MDGIWKYASVFNNNVKEQYRLTLGEGNTPLESNPDVAKALDIQEIFLKREDKNPTGSHKDRSLAYQISSNYQQGIKDFILSSSGNSVISAIAYSRIIQASDRVYLPYNIPTSKLKRLARWAEIHDISELESAKEKEEPFEDGKISIHFTHRAVSDAFKASQRGEGKLLRGSTDDLAVEGFKTMSIELIEQLPDATDIIIPTSSGTTAIGIYEGYKAYFETNKKNATIPRIHIVQTSKVHTLARTFDHDFSPSKTSVAQAIVDKVGHRTWAVNAVSYAGWVLNDEQILSASALLSTAGIDCSYEGAMTIAAIQKARSKGYQFKKPVCIITGVK